MGSATSGGSGGFRPAVAASMVDLDHSDTGPNMLAAAFTTWTIALVFVLLRFWTRARIVRALGLADWFIALSLIAAAGMCISMAVEIRHGMGKHVHDVDLSAHYSPMMEAWWFALLFYILTLALTKVSICLLYLTIFTFEWARRASYAVLFVVVITTLWATATAITNCIPLQATWDPKVVASFCQSQNAWWANTGIVIVTDLMIFILPIPVVVPLKLPRRHKVAVVSIFAVGFFACLVSLIRLIILIQLKRSTDPDFTYNGTDLTYVTVMEVHTAIVVACTMTLKPLATRVYPKLITPRRGGDSSFDESRVVTSGGAPLTVGSKPSRWPPEIQRGGDAMLRDIEEGVHGQAGKEGVGDNETGSGPGSGSSSEGSTANNGDVWVAAQDPWGQSNNGPGLSKIWGGR